MNLKLVSAFFVSLGLVFPVAPAMAEQRVALVIGNGAYEKAEQLPNPKNDAKDVAAALKRAGFETIVGIDLNKSDMEDATIRFARKARSADVALFYYSGHALQFGGVNYLLPVDAELKDEADLRRMARIDQIVQDLQQAKNLRILVLDSCRDNPLAEQLKRSIGLTRAASLQRGLARIDSPQGMIVAFATQAGLTAADGNGRNSPYTTAFLNHIETKEEIGRVFRRISAQVYNATGRAQLPELSLSLIGEYYLHGKPSLPVAPTADACSVWPQISATKSVAQTKAFLAACQSGIYSKLAKAHLSELERRDVAAIDAPPQSALSEAKPNDEPKTPKNVDVGCKKFFPAVGMTFTVPCGAEARPAAPAPQASTDSPDGNMKYLAEAIQSVRKAAEAGDPSAMNTFAVHLETGRGITKDLAEANRWYRKAAEAGNTNAMHNLALNLEKGHGITKDLAEANRWYRKAAPAPQARTVSPVDNRNAAANQKANADAYCVQRYGLGYFAGNIGNDGTYFCIPSKATADARCVQLNSTGYYAVNIRNDGSYVCRPSKAAANAWCVRNNSNGIYAGKINSTGGFNCYAGKAARNADCRRQYGRRWRAGKLNRDGRTWMCYGPRRRISRRGRRRR